jgi:hypothetical protein
MTGDRGPRGPASPVVNVQARPAAGSIIAARATASALSAPRGRPTSRGNIKG